MSQEKPITEQNNPEVRTVSEPKATIRIQTVKIPEIVQEAISRSIQVGKAESQKKKRID